MRKLVIAFLCLILILLVATSCENNSIPKPADGDESETATLQQKIREDATSEDLSSDNSAMTPSNDDPSNDDPSNDEPSNDPGSNTPSSGLGIDKDTDSRFGKIFLP